MALHPEGGCLMQVAHGAISEKKGEETMDINDLSDELKARARECKSADELLKLAAEEGIDLSDEQLTAVAGGNVWEPCSTHDPNNCETLCDMLHF